MATGKNSAAASTRSYRNYKFRSWNRLIRSLYGIGHIARDGARDQKHIGVLGRCYEMHPEALKIVIGISEGRDFRLTPVAGTGI